MNYLKLTYGYFFQSTNSLYLKSCTGKYFHTSSVYKKKPPLKPPPKNFKKFPHKGTIQWAAKQLSDPYVKQRHREGYRCRSVYKLKEIDDKYGILKPGMQVVDLGAAPGSWSQVVVERIFDFTDSCTDNYKNNSGKVVAVDLLRFSSVENVIQIVGDFTDSDIQQKICSFLKNGMADTVICDAAPNACGFKSQDHIALVRLVTKAANFALKILKPHGSFLFKVWNYPEVNDVKTSLSRYFEKTHSVKPAASRRESAEFYILCQNFKINKH